MTATLATPPPTRAGNGLEPSMIPCAVLGGGISGLATAAWLSRAGVSALLLDRADHPGGVIGTVEDSGFTFERGPNTVLDKLPCVDELIDWAGLGAETIRVPMRGQARYIWHAGRLRPVPDGPGALVSTRLFSFAAKLRLLREPFISPVREDETLEDMITRRLGREIYERAFLPMVQGVGAGDPARLSAAASFPLLKELERASGSLIRGFMQKMKADARARRAQGLPRRAIHLLSFPGGLRRLPEAIASRLGEGYQRDVEIQALAPLPNGGGYEIQGLQGGEPRVWRARCVAFCAPADVVARWIEGWEPAAAATLAAAHYSPLAAVGLGVELAGLRIPPGFGFLAARDQGLRVLGSIFASNIFPDRAPEGCAALAVMLGGDLDPSALELGDGAIADLIKADIGRALGWDGRVRALRVNRWPRAIPQYEMGHEATVAALAEAESRRPGLRFLGNWVGGTAIPDRIEIARKAAEGIAEFVKQGNPT